MFVEALEDKTKRFTNAERDLLEWFIGNETTFFTLSAREVSQKNYTTTTTLNRLCKKLGFEGYRELRIYYKGRVPSTLGSSQKIDKYMDFDLIDLEVKEFVDNFERNSRKLIFGVGASYLSAQLLNRILLKEGINTVSLEDKYITRQLIETTESDLVLFSSTGETSVCQELALLAKGYNRKIYTFTKRNSSLSLLSDYHITHNLRIEMLNGYEHEMQIHMQILIEEFIKKLKEN